ncbi:MAG: cohesin domain-containing protein, partial [Patescibacteria group bacterium]|nr:cohesin domain-containing protein [Patescibacteria group bacterium]
MNYQREKRPVDKTAEESYSWMKKKIIFMKKTRVKTWQGMIALAFITGMFSYLILSVEIGTHPISKAAGETSSLALTPSTISVAPGENFDLDIEINTDDAAVVVARAIVNYDTSNFSLISYDISSSVFASSTCSSEGKTACEIIDNDTTSGIIDITLARPSPGVNTSSGLIATLTFQALQATTDDITISFTQDSYTDSDVILDGIGDDGAGTDILSSVANTTVTVVSSACTSFTYSAWSACQPDSTQS